MAWICKNCKDDQFEPETVEMSVNNSTDYAIIDAAAKAWVEAGGDADGVEFLWHQIRDRVGELT